MSTKDSEDRWQIEWKRRVRAAAACTDEDRTYGLLENEFVRLVVHYKRAFKLTLKQIEEQPRSSLAGEAIGLLEWVRPFVESLAEPTESNLEGDVRMLLFAYMIGRTQEDQESAL